MDVKTVKDCIDRAKDVGKRLEYRHPGASKELHRFVVDPLEKAIEAREIDRDQWNTVMIRLQWYENHYAKTA